MKLRFELKRGNIEALYKILQLVAQIWSSSDRILFYFDEDQVIIYPHEKTGFDKVFARIHVLNSQGEGGHCFFSAYQIKSQKHKSAILVAPKMLSSFIEDLKVLVELGYDAQFKLTQTNDGEEVKKYIDIYGTSNTTKDVIRSFVEIESIFDQSFFPEVIENKEVEFLLESVTCQNVLAKFHQRFAILSDEFAKITFNSAKKEGHSQDDHIGDDALSQQPYSLEMNSKHMRTEVTQPSSFVAKFNEVSDMRGHYAVTLKKEPFMKFFSILKQPGSALIKISHKAYIEMEYIPEKSPFIRVIVETPAREI